MICLGIKAIKFRKHIGVEQGIVAFSNEESKSITNQSSKTEV